MFRIYSFYRFLFHLNKINSEVGTKMEVTQVRVHGLDLALVIFNFQLSHTGVS
jgi:hypothetical protein